MAEMVGMANQLMVGQWLQLQRSDLPEWLNNGQSGGNQTKAIIEQRPNGGGDLPDSGQQQSSGGRPMAIARTTAEWRQRMAESTAESTTETRGPDYGREVWLSVRPRRVA